MPDASNRVVIQSVTLTVRNLDQCVEYYQQGIGLALLSREGTRAVLRAGDIPLVELYENPRAVDPGRSTGLYHMAFLLPSRQALAAELMHLTRAGVPLVGMSDHNVSEALYLRDPEGNGIEIYSDRPGDAWPWVNGEVDMTTTPLDVQDLMTELPEGGAAWAGMPEGTIMGHLHLRVADVDSAGAFYRDVLGMDVTTTTYPGALFFSYGGYHHHVGLNAWGTAGASPPPDNATGLRHFTVLVDSREQLGSIRQRAMAQGIRVGGDTQEFTLKDPSGNSVKVTLRQDI